MTMSETHSQPLFATVFLNSSDIVFDPYSGIIMAHSYTIYSRQVNIFLFYTSFTYCLFMLQYLYSFSCWVSFAYSFFYVYCICKILNILVCVNELVFLSWKIRYIKSSGILRWKWITQKKHKSRQDWMEKTIHWELCKGLNW